MAQDPVMAMVEKELKARPDIASSELHAKVAKRHKEIGELSTRQFHARYPLRVKKRWSLETGGTKRPAPKRRRSASAAKAKTSGGTKELLLQFAGELLAEPDDSFTNVLAKVDRYAELIGRR